jgi:hypothetical protein
MTTNSLLRAVLLLSFTVASVTVSACSTHAGSATRGSFDARYDGSSVARFESASALDRMTARGGRMSDSQLVRR